MRGQQQLCSSCAFSNTLSDEAECSPGLLLFKRVHSDPRETGRKGVRYREDEEGWWGEMDVTILNETMPDETRR